MKCAGAVSIRGKTHANGRLQNKSLAQLFPRGVKPPMVRLPRVHIYILDDLMHTRDLGNLFVIWLASDF